MRGSVELGGANHPLPRGSLAISEPRELLVIRSVHGAYECDGAVALNTPHALSVPGLVKPFPMSEWPAGEEVVGAHDEEVVWGGNLIAHYGHFLTESVGRLWPLLPGGELAGLPVVFTMPKVAPAVLEWLRAFGAETVELPESGAVRFRRMFVPEPAWRLENWIAPEIRDIHLHARRGLSVPSTPRHEVTWISRSRLKRGHSPYDEALLEWLLGEHVAIVSPEKMALAEQVAVFEGSRAVAGVIGSAFHTLLMVEQPPDCLYLCPPWDKGMYPAQHRFLDCDASFAPALTAAAWTHPTRRKKDICFPGGYRLLIPEALRALRETLLPALAEDARLMAFAEPERHRPAGRESEIDTAAMRVLLEPLAIEPRLALGAIFEAEGLADCAGEQYAVVADLTDDNAPGPW